MSEVAANAELGKGVNLSDLCTRDEPTAFLGRRRQRKRQSHSIIQNSSENDDFDSDSLSPPNVSMFSSSDSVPFETKTSDLCNEDDEERPIKLANLKENPEIHSFRIVNAADATSNTTGSTGGPEGTAHDKEESGAGGAEDKNSSASSGNGTEAASAADADAGTGKAGAKYVLMCFICKLSFGETKSFFQHAKFEHKISDLKLKKEFAHVDLDKAHHLSAIIQKDANDTPSVCFLEPMSSTNYTNYETLLKGTKIDIPSGEVQESPADYFLKEEALKHRKLTEALQNVVSEQAAADEKNNMLATGGNNNLNSYLFELCRQIYGGALPPMLGNNQGQQQGNHQLPSSKTEPHEEADEKTPNSGRLPLLDPSEMCEVKIKEERDSLTPIKFESPELAKSPVSVKTDRSENGYSGMEHQGLGEDRLASGSPDSMTSNLLAMYQSMAAAKTTPSRNHLPKETDSLSTLFCPEHKFAGNGQTAADCKNCAIVNLIRSSMKSPPPAQQQQQATKVSPNSSFTIGMCPDHLNGRPLGVECMRCEMILNSSRMAGGHSAVTSSTRNSCKTLKCPQCNWHYKYQETLEIHMREKHPDGESACAFCLAGQQHPRLARGESYTCGYKPYRCEICNYSTTTKGNLSIHMQSDKHLNNMQELSNQQQQQQQIVDVEPPLSKTPQKSPPHMAPSPLDLPGLGLSGGNTKVGNAMKPNFRCDVCSYETSVARNLRIHMTSEKHIQNMTALQQNIKQFQFMKQTPPPANIMQQLQNCLPEQAIADYSYNQALLIKLLQHQNQMTDSGMSTPQPEGAGDESAMDEDDMGSKSEGTSGGNTSLDQEAAEAALRATDSNNNAENKEGNRKTPDDAQSWYQENEETRGSDCSDQYSGGGSENRYSDPQRPYKCDVCQESFTQKSILLVHFNSVSHINRIKKQLPGKSVNDEVSSLKRKLSDSEQDSPKKRFKCDICKVAYAQGSTLDIHMRSVLHQTRTCRMNQEQQMRAMQNSGLDTKEPRPNSTGPLTTEQTSAQIYKTLLENFGFDVVKQFNEIDTKLGPQAALDHMYKAGLLTEEMANNKPLSLVPEKNLMADQAMESGDNEGKQFFCRYCNKSFSSIYVLKTHYEDVHNDSLTMDAFAESPKKNFYKQPAFQDDQQVIDFSQKAPKEERSDLISPKRNMTPSTPEQPMVPPVPSFEEQQMLQKHLQTMNMLSLMNQNRVNGDEMQGPPPGAAGNFDLLNLLQFHQHLLSLNFMNLAPPLMINNNVQQPNVVNPMSRPSIRPEATMEESLIPPSFGNAFMPQNNLPPTNQKRARTRITDEQLKILRSHFDINNSPSEESIMEMSKTANLPMKVVKHWFRNTLFKERQKNKDSPYNFNNPPSTTLNLEEYERTGQAKTGGVTPKEADQGQQQQQKEQSLKDQQQKEEKEAAAEKFSNLDEKSQQSNKSFFNNQISDADMEAAAGANNIFAVAAALNVALKSQRNNGGGKSEMSAMSPGANVCNVDAKSECESITSGCSDLINSTNTNGSSQPHSPNDFWSQTPSPIFQQNAGMDLVSGKKFKGDGMSAGPSSQNGSVNGGGGSSMGSSGKRANRTRFTDYQIKVLQEFFENNSYPKDSDLEYLSKMLLLSPRVIVVWFQNARQKQRKIYENQPNNIPGIGMSSSSNGGGSSPIPSGATGHGASPMDSPTSSVYSNDGDDKTKHLSGSNISYTCKKCSSVFQRYYELIRHQKNHCFKEENNKKSAKAQIAAAQIAQQCLANPLAVGGGGVASAPSVGDLEQQHHQLQQLAKSPKTVFPGGAPSQQHLAAIMAAAAMAVASNTEKGGDFVGGSGSLPDAAVDKEEHMDMVRNLTAILGSVANNQSNDCPPLHLPGAPEQYNLPSELREMKSQSASAAAATTSQEEEQGQRAHEPSSADQMMCNKSYDESYSNASESTADKPSDSDALTQNPSTTTPPPTAAAAGVAGLGLFLTDDSLPLDSSSNQHLPKINLQPTDAQASAHATPTATPVTTPTTTSQATKRLRTTITPEQLHFLYDCYQQESNPSRKMLEQIAKQVNLKKRVVQVWYQNSRARERKGQYRTSTNIMASQSGMTSNAGHLMMDNFGGGGGSSVGGSAGLSFDGSSVDSMKSPKMSDAAADLGFLFNSFKQHY